MAIAATLTGSVLLSSVHAKDIAKSAPLGQDLSSVHAKALGELHNHTDKTVVKVFAKAVSDNAIVARERELRTEVVRIERGLVEQLADFLMFWRVAFSVRL